jgi:hypothetical protein
MKVAWMNSIRFFVVGFALLFVCPSVWGSPVDIGRDYVIADVLGIPVSSLTFQALAALGVYDDSSIAAAYVQKNERQYFLSRYLSSSTPGARTSDVVAYFGIDQVPTRISTDSVQVAWTQMIPEPSSMLLFTPTMLGLIVAARDKSRKRFRSLN